MSLAVLTSLLNTTCTISRFTAASVDVYGQPTGSWANLATGVLCRLQEFLGVSDVEAEAVTPGGTAVIASHKLFVLSSQDITEKDRVVVGSNTYDVQFCAASPGGVSDHHKEVWLKVVR